MSSVLSTFNKLYFLFFFIILVSPYHSQELSKQILNVNEVVLSTSDRTYLSFGQGFGNYKTAYGIKRLTPLVFEGQLSPNFFISLSKKKNIGLAFSPKIVIRMYNEPSVPVKTPSYMPNILFYHKIRSPFPKKIFRSIIPENQLTFLTYRLMHHSNGQDGSYFIPYTDSINFKNGNFSTNAIEVAFSWSSIDSNTIGKTFVNGRISYERQFDFEREDNLKNSYYYNKISLENHFIYSQKVKAYVTYSLMWGTHKFGTRHTLDIFCAFKPFQKIANFSVFVRAYVGPDYYNLYYVNSLRAVTFGIIADPLNIPIFNKKR